MQFVKWNPSGPPESLDVAVSIDSVILTRLFNFQNEKDVSIARE
jgi:hypothetical protein